MNTPKNTSPLATSKRKREGEELEQTFLKKTRNEMRESNQNRVEESKILKTHQTNKKTKKKKNKKEKENKGKTKEINVEKQNTQNKKMSKRLDSLNQLLESQTLPIRTQLKTWAGKLLSKTIGTIHNEQRKKHMENNPTFLPKSIRFGFKLIQKPVLEGNQEYEELENNTVEIMKKFKEELRNVIVKTQLLEESEDLKQRKKVFTDGLTELFMLGTCYNRRKCSNMEIPGDDEAAGKIIKNYFMNIFIFKEECSQLLEYLNLEPKQTNINTTLQQTCFVTAAAEAERTDSMEKEFNYIEVSDFICNTYLSHILEISVNLTERYREERAEEEAVARTSALLNNITQSSATVETLNAIKADKILSPTTIGEMIEDSVVRNVKKKNKEPETLTDTDTSEDEITPKKNTRRKPKNFKGARMNQTATSLSSTGSKEKELGSTQNSLNLTPIKHSSLKKQEQNQQTNTAKQIQNLQK